MSRNANDRKADHPTTDHPGTERHSTERHSTTVPEAALLPEGDVIRILLEQHARIRELFAAVPHARGRHKQVLFDELRELLSVHEAVEELALRPASTDVVGQSTVDARNAEEAEASRVLHLLEAVDVHAATFDSLLADFEVRVLEHADKEEKGEFRQMVRNVDPDKRRELGRAARVAGRIAPTHPHPFAAGSTLKQFLAGPVVGVLDRVRDARG